MAGFDASTPFMLLARIHVKPGCVDAYLLRIGHGSHGRKACFDRDKGICAACKRDCHGLFLRLKPLPADRRREVLLEEFAGPDGPGSLLTTRRLEGIVKRCQEGDIWEADHIKPVAGGGGEATSSAQLQTLCVPCHNAKTRRDGRPKKQARSTDVPRRKSGAGAVSSHVEPLVDAEMDAAASAGSSSKMTAEVLGWPRTASRALNMPIPGTAHSSNPFGGCAMAMREPGHPPSSEGVPPRAGRLSQGGRRRLWPPR